MREEREKRDQARDVQVERYLSSADKVQALPTQVMVSNK
jgi:hypothetical protein